MVFGVLFSSFNSALLEEGISSTHTQPNSPKMSIGMEAHGGVIFYLDKSRRHGLVVSTENVGERSTKYEWGCSGTKVIGANGTKVGTGLANTHAIAGSCKDVNQAAQACLDYTQGTYEDWYLPSLEELELISKHLGAGSDFSELVNFDRTYYFSSSQLKNKKYQGNYAWTVNLLDNYPLFSLKSSKHKVRAVRSF